MRNDEMISHKKGDSSWKVIPQLSRNDECCMVYKDHKLYSLDGAKLIIFDISGDIPLKIIKTSVDVCIRPLPRDPRNLPLTRVKNHVVVRVSGDVLIVTSIRRGWSKTWDLQIYKMDSFMVNHWEEIFSLGDEAILLELGITVLAKDIEGLKGNPIYFSSGSDHLFSDGHDENGVFIFNLDTKKES